MRTTVWALAVLAIVNAGCRDGSGSNSGSAPTMEVRSDAEAAAAAAARAKGEAEMERIRSGRATTFELAAPQPLAPVDGSDLADVAGKITLKWTPVTGAAKYRVEVEYQVADTGQWLRAIPETETVQTEMQFEFAGGRPGRWRTWGIDSSGREGPRSAWWSFRFPR